MSFGKKSNWERSFALSMADRKVYSKTQSVKKKLIVERGHKCQQCGRHMQRVHGHHLVSIRKGGDNDPSNIILLCRDCHQLEHRHGVGA